MSATDALIAFVQSTDYSLLPGDVISQAKRCVLDLLGVAIAGSHTRMAEASMRFAVNQFAPGNATLIGSRARLGEVGAAWFNGICASALDLDDGHRLAMGHPGAAVIPTAMAVAESSGASGAEFLAAVVAGYEVAVRVSVARVPHYKTDHYSTGIWAPPGSVAAAGKILGLNERMLQDALGIAIAHGPFPPSGAVVLGGMVKEAIGWAGVVGCSAALLAREGFAGCENALDRSGRYDVEQLSRDLGTEYAIRKTYFKPYAACRWSHPAIDAILELVRDRGLQAGEIDEIHVEGFQQIRKLCDYAPATSVAAQYSLPFALALTLTYGRIGPEELIEANLQDEELAKLARKVRVSVDPGLDRLFPEKTASRVTVLTGRGSFTASVEYPRGNPENPLSDAQLAEKFLWLAADAIGERKSRKLMHAVERLEEMDNVVHLTELLAFQV
jgi:2-methylcitrate dehydratase PrpD